MGMAEYFPKDDGDRPEDLMAAKPSTEQLENSRINVGCCTLICIPLCHT